MEKLTEDNIKHFGFEQSGANAYWRTYNHKDEKISIKFVFKLWGIIFPNTGFIYGSDFIKIDTVEELKILYLLVTKKEL